MSKALFIDLAFANVGWVVMELDKSGYNMIESGCIKTEKSDKSRKIRVASDDMRRCGEIAQELLVTIRDNDIQVVASEDPHGGAQNARAARCLGMATAILGTIETILDIPFLHITPSEGKIALCGKKGASKNEMMDAASKLFPMIEDIPKVRKEHIADAVGVALAVKEDPVIRMLRRI